jgi:hypothetical protein
VELITTVSRSLHLDRTSSLIYQAGMGHFRNRGSFGPYRVTATGMSEVEDHIWIVSLSEVSAEGHYCDLSEDGRVEVTQWLLDMLDITPKTIERNLRFWGMSFKHESDALLCFMNYR